MRDLDYFSASTIAKTWDYFNAMPFEIKSRIIILGLIHLVLANSKEEKRLLVILDHIFKTELAKEKEVT